MSLLGLVRHMAEVERSWFRRRFAEARRAEALPDRGRPRRLTSTGRSPTRLWPRRRGRRGAWRSSFAEQFTRDHDLDFVGYDSEGEPVSLRELLVHMIEEYARHNGHADLLRERIYGRLGQYPPPGAATPWGWAAGCRCL